MHCGWLDQEVGSFRTGRVVMCWFLDRNCWGDLVKCSGRGSLFWTTLLVAVRFQGWWVGGVSILFVTSYMYYRSQRSVSEQWVHWCPLLPRVGYHSIYHAYVGMRFSIECFQNKIKQICLAKHILHEYTMQRTNQDLKQIHAADTMDGETGIPSHCSAFTINPVLFYFILQIHLFGRCVNLLSFSTNWIRRYSPKYSSTKTFFSIWELHDLACV